MGQETETSYDLTQTLTGRLRNFPLAPSPDNALWGLYEAVANSLHAIRDTGCAPKSGNVSIYVKRDENGELQLLEIVDNGIGLNDKNFESFRRIDSTFKAVRGGKGVGRLTWLKTFDNIHVTSIYDEGSRSIKRSFDFIEDDTRPIRNHTLENTSEARRTSVTLSGMKNAYSRECPRRTETFRRSVIRHFLKDVITKDGPSITIYDNDIVDLRDAFAASVERRVEGRFSLVIEGIAHEFNITSLVVSKAFADHEAKENAVYLLAHGRVVGMQTVGGLIGLTKLQGGRTYVGLIEGLYLDEAVTQERTMLSADSTIINNIVRRAADEAVLFLQDETRPVRDRQLTMVKQIKREYPRFIGTLSEEEEEFVKQKLPLSVRDQESVFRAVSLEWYRSKRKVDRSIRAGLSNPKNDAEFQKALDDANASIAVESKAILADYLTERKVVIDFLERLVARVRSSPDGDYETEARVHDLIAPRKSNSANTKIETHSLWLIDERLPYYYYFNSDIALSQQIENCSDLRRPDITLSDVASSFKQRGANEPFIIVEFKRPGRNNYNSKDDPVKQCLDYVLELKEGRNLTDASGAWNSSVQDNTLFYCYVVADITPTLRRLLEFHDMKKTPDGRGYFRFHDGLKAWCEVVPYDKLIESNRVRHNAFFEKLGLS